MMRLVSPLFAIWQKAERSRAMLPMLFSICCVGTGSAVLTTSVSLHLGKPDIDTRTIQAVLTAYPLGFLAGCLVTRPIVARFRHEWAFVVVTLIGVLAALGLYWTDNWLAWIVFRLLGGLSMAALFIICESWINLYADQNNRGRYFSLYMLTTAVAVLFGQLLVAAAGPKSPHLFLVGAVTILAGPALKFIARKWPDLPTLRENGAAPVAERYGLLQLAKLAPVTVVSIFQAGITNLNMFVLTPIYGEKIGMSATTTIGLISTLSIAGIVAQTPVGWLSDRFDRRFILLVQGILSVGLCSAIATVGNGWQPLLFALFFCYGAVALTIYPVAIAFANSQLHSRYMVSVSGTLFLLYSIGNVLTPGLAAGLMQRTAPEAMFLVLGSGAVLVAASACFNLMRPPAFRRRGIVCGTNK